VPPGKLAGEGRAGNGQPLLRDGGAEYLGRHLRNGFERIGLETLGEIDQDLIFPEHRLQAPHHRADEFRRHGQDQNAGGGGRPLQVGRGFQAAGQFDAGQEGLVLPRRIDGLEDVLFPDPDAHVFFLAGQVIGERRAPGTAADDQYIIHFSAN
jgi:hypothetical protein